MNNLALLLISNSDTATKTRAELAKEYFDSLVGHQYTDLEVMLKSSTPSLLVLEDKVLPSPAAETLSQLVQTSGIPIIVVNGAGSELDTAKALDCGALECARIDLPDAEFSARLKHGARLAAALFPSPGELNLFEAARLRYRENRLIGSQLTIKLGFLETQLLLALGAQPGKPVARDVLCHAAWRRTLMPGDRRLDIRIVALNQKLREATGGHLAIRGVRNAGYRLEANAA